MCVVCAHSPRWLASQFSHMLDAATQRSNEFSISISCIHTDTNTPWRCRWQNYPSSHVLIWVHAQCSLLIAQCDPIVRQRRRTGTGTYCFRVKLKIVYIVSLFGHRIFSLVFRILHHSPLSFASQFDQIGNFVLIFHLLGRTDGRTNERANGRSLALAQNKNKQFVLN